MRTQVLIGVPFTAAASAGEESGLVEGAGVGLSPASWVEWKGKAGGGRSRASDAVCFCGEFDGMPMGSEFARVDRGEKFRGQGPLPRFDLGFADE